VPKAFGPGHSRPCYTGGERGRAAYALDPIDRYLRWTARGCILGLMARIGSVARKGAAELTVATGRRDV
jgi:hypothetical protein